MNPQRFIAPFIVLCLFTFFLTFNSLAQETQNPPTGTEKLDVSPVLDSKLTGTWLTEARNATFSKIIFGDGGSFSGYTLVTDSKPFASGTYQIINGGINVSASIGEPSVDNKESVSVTYIYSKYSIKDNKLQITLSDTKATIEYTKSDKK